MSLFIAGVVVGSVAGSAVGVAAQDAATEPATPAVFTAEIGWADGCTSGSPVVDADVERTAGWSCGPQTWTATDARFSGSASNTWNHDTYRLADGTYSATVGHLEIENDAGRWVCPYVQLETGVGLQSRPIDGGYVATCTGNAGYEGLSALLSLASAEGQTGVNGLIFEGALPPGPEVSGA